VLHLLLTTLHVRLLPTGLLLLLLLPVFLQLFSAKVPSE
jgi:hypothetical protein